MNLQLTIIGSTIFAIGVAIIAVANIKRKVCKPLWENEQVRYTRPSVQYLGGKEPAPQYPSYVFSLQYPSLVKGKISSKVGPYTFYICEYFGPQTTPESLSKSKIYYIKNEMPQESFELELPRGNYCVGFLTGGHIEARFSIKECYDIKPHERWFGLGQTLLEVGIPLLITGIVIF